MGSTTARSVSRPRVRVISMKMRDDEVASLDEIAERSYRKRSNVVR